VHGGHVEVEGCAAPYRVIRAAPGVLGTHAVPPSGGVCEDIKGTVPLGLGFQVEDDEPVVWGEVFAAEFDSDAGDCTECNERVAVGHGIPVGGDLGSIGASQGGHGSILPPQASRLGPQGP